MKTYFSRLVLLIVPALMWATAGNFLSSGQVSGVRVMNAHYNSIDVSSGIELVISRISSDIIVEVPARNAAQVTTEVKDGVLVVKKAAGGKKGSYKVMVPAGEYRRISSASGCVVNLAENFRADRIELNMNGGSVLKGQIFCNSLTLNLSNGSVADIKGKSEEFNVTASGGSVAECYELATGYVTASAKGGSVLKLYVDKELKSYASSASVINYRGSGNVLAQEATSGAVIRKK